VPIYLDVLRAAQDGVTHAERNRINAINQALKALDIADRNIRQAGNEFILSCASSFYYFLLDMLHCFVASIKLASYK